jgi:hypothetical protein
MTDFINIDSNSIVSRDEINLLSESVHEDYKPIHKNANLLKFILYTTKFEIKSNSLIKMIYTTSLFEFFLWFVGFLLFISSPSTMYLIMVLIIHPIKAISGFILLNNIPKTYEIIENASNNPNFKEDEIIDLIKDQIKEMFVQRWTDKKKSLLVYFVITILAIIFDVVIFIVQIVIFGNIKLLLMESTLMLIILIFLGNFYLFYSYLILSFGCNLLFMVCYFEIFIT